MARQIIITVKTDEDFSNAMREIVSSLEYENIDFTCEDRIVKLQTTETLQEIKEQMTELSNDPNAMYIEHEFADDILDVINKTSLTVEEKTNSIKDYCIKQFINNEEIVADEAVKVLETLIKEV